MLFLYLNLLTNYQEMRENNIKNTCNFQIVRFKKSEVSCIDTGKYSFYCNHYALPYEFVIIKEKTVNNKDLYTIKPEAIYEETNYNKIILANFYYNFKCSKKDNEPKLSLIIVPSNDNSPLNILMLMLIFLAAFIVLVLLCNSDDDSLLYCLLCCPDQRRRVYCE